MKKTLTSVLLILAAGSMNAADFFSTERSEQLFTFGARIGVNTSNRTMGDNAFPGGYHNESWRTGFDLGFVADLNFRDYLSIQPGLFFDVCNSGYTVLGHSPAAAVTGDYTQYAQAGKLRTFNLTIPVMAVVGFNVTDDLRWTVEAGPYVSFVMGSKLSGKYIMSAGSESSAIFAEKPASVDFGVKMGTGIRIKGHYYVGAHYLAGCLDAWKDRKLAGYSKNLGGVTKTWVFTVGYNF